MEGKFESQQTLNERVDQHKCQFFLAFFIIGVLNKSGVAIVMTAAEGLSDKFGMQSQMALILLGIQTVGVLTRFLNGVICIKIKHTKRIVLVGILTMTAFLIISAVCFLGEEQHDKNLFYCAVLASSLVGVAESTGETTIVGFLHGFPTKLISEVSSGTGFGGVFATMTLLLARSLGISDGWFFLLNSPLILVYVYCFFWVDTQKSKYKFYEIEKSDEEIESSNYSKTINSSKHDHQLYHSEDFLSVDHSIEEPEDVYHYSNNK